MLITTQQLVAMALSGISVLHSMAAFFSILRPSSRHAGCPASLVHRSVSVSHVASDPSQEGMESTDWQHTTNSAYNMLPLSCKNTPSHSMHLAYVCGCSSHPPWPTPCCCINRIHVLAQQVQPVSASGQVARDDGAAHKST